MNTSIIAVDQFTDLAEILANNLRQADALELEASDQLPLQTIRSSIRDSHEDLRWACIDNEGFPLGIFGCAPSADPELGIAWLLTSEAILNHKREVWMHSKKIVQEMHKRYPKLCNWVDSRNTVSIGWLERLGFIAEPDQAIELNGVPFIKYSSSINV